MKVVCYDPEGNERLKEPVDARECVEHCGFTMERPEAKEVEAEVEVEAEKVKKKAGRPPKKVEG